MLFHEDLCRCSRILIFNNNVLNLNKVLMVFICLYDYDLCFLCTDIKFFICVIININYHYNVFVVFDVSNFL